MNVKSIMAINSRNKKCFNYINSIVAVCYVRDPAYYKECNTIATCENVTFLKVMTRFLGPIQQPLIMMKSLLTSP